ncbi:MAG: hypothetical protein WHT63_01235 [Tepidiforma sp.]
MNGIDPGGVPPARAVAPFLVTAPLGLAVAGIALLGAGPGTLDGPSTPALLAAVHGTVLGWLTLSIMGATLQLVPSVLGGRAFSVRTALAAFVLHSGGVTLMVAAFAGWRLPLLASGATFAAAGVAVYLLTAARPLITARARGPEVASLQLAHLFLSSAVAAGLSLALALRLGWFGVTPGLVAAHAHLGIVGWLAIAITGVTYRLLPMFGIVRGTEPRFANVLPWALAAAAGAAFVVLAVDPPPAARLVLEGALAGLGLLWLSDALRLYRSRLRRRADLYSRATLISFAFLVAGLLMAPFAAVLPPDSRPVSGPALQAACGFLILPGWAGATLIANSYKIVPFIAWYHRYSAVAGARWTPGTGDLYSSRLAHGVLVLVSAGAGLGAAASLASSLPLLRLAGAAFVAAGLIACATLAGTYVVRPEQRSVAPPAAGMPAPATRR